MNIDELEALAQALFEKENTDPTMLWRARAVKNSTGADVFAGITETTREKYRNRIRNGER